MSDDTLISVAHIHHYYGSHCALNDVSFQARRGEVTGFLGPNGAGKSTLMQILCGVLAASSGKVAIAGFDILDSPLDARANLGYLPEHPPLYQDCTVDDYLNYCAVLRGISPESRAEQINICKTKCNLQEHGQRMISSLSKGYQQRLGLAQAIIHDPRVLVLDEPSSGLDPEQIIEMRKLIKEFGQDRCVIFSTHILSEAQNVCDRILVLNNGTIAFDKAMHEVQNLEQLYMDLTRTPSSELLEH